MNLVKKYYKKVFFGLFLIGTASFISYAPRLGATVTLSSLKSDAVLQQKIDTAVTNFISQQSISGGKYQKFLETDTGFKYQNLVVTARVDEYVAPDRSIGYIIVFKIIDGKTKYIKSYGFGSQAAQFTSDWEKIDI